MPFLFIFLGVELVLLSSLHVLELLVLFYDGHPFLGFFLLFFHLGKLRIVGEVVTFLSMFS